MLVILICFIAAIFFTVIAVIFSDEFDVRECIAYVAALFAVLCWIAFIIMVVIAIVVNVGAEGDIAANQQLYDSLVYQLENDLYDNDNDVGKRELYEKVTEWNTDLARGQTMQHDEWVGVFYPNIYDGFDFIQLPINN